MSLRDSAEAARHLSEALSLHARTLVETDEVESVDASHLQILVGAHRMATAQNRQFAVTVPQGGALDAALVRSGIANALDARLVWDGRNWTGLDLSSPELHP
ncbi:MAG: hypothetical protein INR68_08140 [Methylobacterium mesophilicum]|nr:hypothetical protein [Methylobacterium mesophilicum]